MSEEYTVIAWAPLTDTFVLTGVVGTKKYCYEMCGELQYAGFAVGDLLALPKYHNIYLAVKKKEVIDEE